MDEKEHGYTPSKPTKPVFTKRQIEKNELRRKSTLCEDWALDLAKLIAAENWLQAAKVSAKLLHEAQQIRIATCRIVEEELKL